MKAKKLHSVGAQDSPNIRQGEFLGQEGGRSNKSDAIRREPEAFFSPRQGRGLVSESTSEPKSPRGTATNKASQSGAVKRGDSTSKWPSGQQLLEEGHATNGNNRVNEIMSEVAELRLLSERSGRGSEHGPCTLCRR